MAPKKKPKTSEKTEDGPAEEAKEEVVNGAAEEKPAEETVLEKAAEEEGVEKAEDATADAVEEAKDQETKEDGKEAEESKEETKDEPMEEAKAEEPAVEEQKELEEDAPEDTRTKVKGSDVAWSAVDATLNVMMNDTGSLFTSLTDGGCQYMLAAVRTSSGLKAGRYMLEVKILENLYPYEPKESRQRTPSPQQLVRIGLSLGGSSLFLADTGDSVCFDSEGYVFHGKKRSKVSEKFSKNHTVALLINLDEKSPNANTVSLFRDGHRISPPQKLPENMQGQVLYPTLTYKNVSLRVNLGPAPMQFLPFSCRMLGDAANADVELVKSPSSGPCEVVFPVGLPGQGLFDYVDSFLEKNSQHVELSDRKFLEWAEKSGIWRPKGYSQKSSLDKPDMNFNIQLMDDGSVQAITKAIAPALKRNYVVNELMGNLLVEERKLALQRFSGPAFKKKAVVLMGEPPAEYKERVQNLMLQEKIAAAEAERRKKAADEERERLMEMKKKKAEEARKNREGKKNGKEEEEKQDDQTAAEEKVEESKEAEEAPAPVELTEEEKKLWYRKTATPDVSDSRLAKSYAHFTMPTAEEGFDEIVYVWQPKEKCEEHLRAWILDQKRTQRAEDLEPSDWFKGEMEKWKKSFMDWKKKQNDYKDPVKRKYAQKKKEEEAQKVAEGKDGEAEEGEKAEEKPMDINAEDIEVDGVEDVTDLGNGEPLFANFVYEDWTLAALRFELHLLVNAFRKDLNDPDRPGFREVHLEYYYSKYYNKEFSLKNLGVEKFEDFLELVEDTLCLSESSGMLESKLPEDVAHSKIIKLAEEHRRDRIRRVDAGDETAQLKFKKPAPPPARQAAPSKSDRGKGGDKSKAGDRRDAGREADRGRDRGGKDDRGKGRPAPRGAPPPRTAPPPSRYSSSGGSGRNDSYSSSRGGGSSYDSSKRSHGSSYGSSYPPAKQARTSSYSGGGGGGGKGGGKGGGYGGGYRR